MLWAATEDQDIQAILTFELLSPKENALNILKVLYSFGFESVGLKEEDF